MKTTLCVMFNHPYLKNIPLIRQALGKTFDSIKFIVPYTISADEDVITSYRGSYCFHGFVVDAAEKLLQSDSDYFFFMQDDVVLNPNLSSETLVDRLRLDHGGAFLPELKPIGGELTSWYWTLPSIWKIFYPMNRFSGSGAENWLAALPPAEDSFSSIKSKYGFDFAPIFFDRSNIDVPNDTVTDQFFPRLIFKTIAEILFEPAELRSNIRLPYPFCFGMSDFFALNRDALTKLIHPLGVFAAAEFFVELAIPTAMAIAVDHVCQCTDVGLVANWLWGEDRASIDLGMIKGQFQDNVLLVHPIKISQEAALYGALHGL